MPQRQKRIDSGGFTHREERRNSPRNSQDEGNNGTGERIRRTETHQVASQQSDGGRGGRRPDSETGNQGTPFAASIN
jgi:hypothetical protein